MAAFSLAENPFVILPVSPHATSAQVEAAFAACVAERPQDEPLLGAARQALISPGARLRAELSWLIDISPRDAAPLLTAMSGFDKEALLEAVRSQPPLTRANVAADACRRFKSTDFIGPLAAAHSRLDAAEITAIVNGLHEAAGLPIVEVSKVDAALGDLAHQHAAVAIEAIAAEGDVASVRDELLHAPPSASSRFLDDLLAQYDRGQALRLATVDESAPHVPPQIAAPPEPGPVTPQAEIPPAASSEPLFVARKSPTVRAAANRQTAILLAAAVVVVILAVGAALFEYGPQLIALTSGADGAKGPAATNTVAPAPSAAPGASDDKTPTASMAPNGVAETMPPVGAAAVLSQNQLRYCIFTKERLSASNPPFRTFGYIDKFNAALADYNSRCGHVKYMSNDFAVVTLQLQHEAPRLQGEAAALAKDWSQ